MKCASCGCSITASICQEAMVAFTPIIVAPRKEACAKKSILGEKQLAEQIKNFLQKVSLSSQDTEKVLAALDTERNSSEKTQARG